MHMRPRPLSDWADPEPDWYRTRRQVPEPGVLRCAGSDGSVACGGAGPGWYRLGGPLAGAGRAPHLPEDPRK